LLLLDAQSGIAGDMTIAALVDLGVPMAVVQAAVAALRLPGVSVDVREHAIGAIGASALEVTLPEANAERHYHEIDALIAQAPLASEVSALARRIFRRLAEAESAVHRIPMEQVHFHEVGALDAIVDVVGAAACFVHLTAEVVCTPLPMGRGFVDCRHGTLPLPAPATVLCLRGVPTYSAGIEAELVTPTGAAIAATVAERFEHWPALAPERVGWGRGTREIADRPNALRVVLGAPSEVSSAAVAPPYQVLEANVDDMTGELAAHAIAALLDAGALDAWAAAVTMKKGRPGLVLSVLVERGRAEQLCEVLLRETSSIGVRHHAVSRLERPRRMLQVSTPYGPIAVKVSEGPYGPPQLKPEFDDCARAAAEHRVPVREVVMTAQQEARKLVGSPAGT
jgi:hypothetical protein